jgi:heme o synthase
MHILKVISDYLEVTKPRATFLLAFIGVASVVIAGGGAGISFSRLVLIIITILAAAAGANGLTNYLDRNVDARMARTKHRALAAKRIDPPEKVLPLLLGLVAAGLMLSWFITPNQPWHPALLADAVGTLASVVWRKRATCVFPQGLLAGCAPVLIGWFAVNPRFEWELALLCMLIGLWLPLHVWSVMVANREDYVRAGIAFFPVNRNNAAAFKLLSGFVLALVAASLAIYFVGGFSVLYLAAALILGGLMVFATSRLRGQGFSRNAWKLYKLSSFPYLGLIFLIMSLDKYL